MVTIAFPKYEEVLSYLSEKLKLSVEKIEKEITEFGKRYEAMSLRKDFVAIFFAKEKGFPVVIKHIPSEKKKVRLRDIVEDARGITVEGLLLSKRDYVSRRGEDTMAAHITDGSAVCQLRAKPPFKPEAGDYVSLNNVNVSYYKQTPYIFVGVDTVIEILPKVSPSDYLPKKKVGELRTGEIVSIRAVPLQERVNRYVGCPLCHTSAKETPQGAAISCQNCGKGVTTVSLAWTRFLLMDDSGTIFCSMPPSLRIENSSAFIGKIVEIFGQVQDNELRVWDIRLCPEFKKEKMMGVIEAPAEIAPPVLVESKSLILASLESGQSSIYSSIETKSEVV